MKRAVILALAVVAAVSLRAAEPGVSTILVPTLYNGPGAFGSTWWSSVVVNNHSPLPFSSPGVEFIIQCPIPEGCFSEEVPAGEFGGLIAPRPAGGLLLYAPAEVAENLAFQARFGQGNSAVTNGAELPLVREREFKRGEIHLPSVQLHLTQLPVRTTLRVYGVDALPGTTVRIDVRSWHVVTGGVRASKIVSLHVPESPAGSSRPIYPAYAQIALQQEFPFESLLGSAFNITIVPLPLESGEVPRIWAFLSTTSNVSQQVEIQQPQ